MKGDLHVFSFVHLNNVVQPDRRKASHLIKVQRNTQRSPSHFIFKPAASLSLSLNSMPGQTFVLLIFFIDYIGVGGWSSIRLLLGHVDIVGCWGVVVGWACSLSGFRICKNKQIKKKTLLYSIMLHVFTILHISYNNEETSLILFIFSTVSHPLF